jgi:hypothetical protein
MFSIAHDQTGWCIMNHIHKLHHGKPNAGMSPTAASMGPAQIGAAIAWPRFPAHPRLAGHLANDRIGGPDWYSKTKFAIRMNAELHVGVFSIFERSAFWHPSPHVPCNAFRKIEASSYKSI